MSRIAIERLRSTFILLLSFIATLSIVGQAPTNAGGTATGTTGVPITFPARSNYGSPAYYTCYTDNLVCPGGRNAPNVPISWIVDGTTMSSTTLNPFGGDDQYTCTYVDFHGDTQSVTCHNYYSTGTLTVILAAGTHTVTAYIPATGDQYTGDPYAAFTTTWNVTISDPPPPPVPHLVSLSTNTASQGDLLTVTGDTFGTSPGAVYIGNLIAPLQGSWSDTSLQVQVPGNLSAGGVFVTVKAAGQTSNGLPLSIKAQQPTSVLCNADTNAPQNMAEIYHFCVPDSASGAGYAADGNLTSYSDSVNGDWTFTYDTLNRLRGASSLAGMYKTLTLDMGYDSFGNRTHQISGTSGQNPNLPTVQSWSQSYDVNNRMQSGITYDGSGNVTNDSTNQIAYDADGNVCAVWNANAGMPWVTQYLYNAEGRRVAKGHSQANPMMVGCSDGGTDFIATATYGLGLGGEQVSEFDGSTSWKHSNVFAEGILLATYDSAGLHYHLTDNLGTARLQYSADQNVPDLHCSNLPFGDTAQGTPPCSASHATENFFTGKERDTESGLDYFKYRMYASSMGRWMSPDPSGLTHADLSNPQSLNLYNYVGNSPLTRTDLDGLCWKGFQWACNAIQSLDNGFHGLGFQTNASVDKEQHTANQMLHHDGIQTEGLNRRQVRKAYKLDMALGSVRAEGDDGFTYVSRVRPSAAQARAIWEKATGEKVPWDDTMDRFYDMSHKTPIGDGGSPTDPNNLEPMLHSDHVEMHRQNGDFVRWGARGSTPGEPGQPIDTVIQPGVPVEPTIMIEPIDPIP